MIKIYHAGSSVCSQKVRLALAEKDLPWISMDIDMTKGEHMQPDYLKLNPEAVVPTLVEDDGFVVRESSVIIDYLDQMGPDNLLMPTDRRGQATTRLWLIRCIEIHAAINSMSFATQIRVQLLAAMGPDQLEKWYAALPNPQIAAKRRDLLEHGAASVYVDGALQTILRMLTDMNAALENGPWLLGERYGLADLALTAYVDRLARLAMSGLWEGRFDHIQTWLQAVQSRPSYAQAIVKYYNAEAEAAYLEAGQAAWPQIQARL